MKSFTSNKIYAQFAPSKLALRRAGACNTPISGSEGNARGLARLGWVMGQSVNGSSLFLWWHTSNRTKSHFPWRAAVRVFLLQSSEAVHVQ